MCYQLANFPLLVLAFGLIHCHYISKPDLMPHWMSIVHKEGAELDELSVWSFTFIYSCGSIMLLHATTISFLLLDQKAV